MEKKIKYKKGIRRKITLMIFLSVLVVVGIVISAGFFWGFNLLRDTIGEDYLNMTKLLSQAFNRIVDEEVADLEIYMSNPLWKKKFEEYNTKYGDMDESSIKNYFNRMDREWIDASLDDALVREYLDKLASERLRALIENDTDMAEMFITDKFGGLIAASGKTSDFYQADEEWWQETFAKGKGKLFIGDVLYDESSGVMSITFAIPIRNDKGDVIGIAKSVLDINRFFAPLENFKIQKTGHAVLIDEKGFILFHPDVKPLSSKFVEEKKFQELIRKKSQWMVMDDPYYHKEAMFVACTSVKHPNLLERGIMWRICISRKAKEVFAPLEMLIFQILNVVIISILSVLVVGYILSGIFVKPIKALHKATGEVAKGDLDYKVEINTNDEIEELAGAFNKMTRDLRGTTASIGELNKEVEGRKKAEEVLRTTLNFSQTLLNTIPFGMDIVDEKGNILFVNKILEGALGKNLTGKKCWEVYKDDKKQCNACPLKKGIQIGETASIETAGVCGGKTFLISHTGMAYKGKRAILEIFQDITERKVADEAVRESELKYKTIFDSSKDAVMTLTPGKGFLSGNRATIEMFTCKDEKEFTGKAPADLSPEHQPDGALSSAKAQEMMATAMREGSHFFEWKHKRLNGAEFFATVLLTRMELKGEKILQATVRDITEQKVAEEKIKESTRVKSEFTSMVSHELRTPLTAIKEGIGIVLDGSAGKVNNEQADFLGTAKRNVDRLARLINDVLDVQKLESGMMSFQMQENNINELVKEVYKQMIALIKEKELDFTLELDDKIPNLKFDRDKIIQVLMNIVSNGVKFTEKGGITIATVKGNNIAQISIKDTGLGIREEDMPRLFKKFEQLEQGKNRKTGGTGLGLAISKEIVQEHRGKIWAESKIGKGTTFHIILPIKERRT